MFFPSTLMPDSESVALSFFFLTYGSSSAGQEIEATCSYLGLIPQAFAKCLSTSPLALATAALAVNVTCLWRRKGSDAAPARQYYSQAVTAVKKAVADPIESTSDDLLMATLVLEAYDVINSHVQRKHSLRLGTHMSGSVALMRHRAALNYRDEISQRMVIAVRSKIIDQAILGRWDAIGEFRDIWEDESPLPQNPAATADKLAYRLYQLREQTSQFGSEVVGSNCQLLLARASALATDCTRWIEELPEYWHAVAVPKADLEESIRAAGVYDACDVYSNMAIANIRNWHRIIELSILRILQLLQADRNSSASADQGFEASKIASRMQVIVDEMCASVPYLFGDMTRPCVPFLGDTVKFPHVAQAPWGTALSGRPRTLPESLSRHERQVASSGGMKVYRVMKAVVALVEDGKGSSAQAFKLREGQLDWIKSQVSRFRRQLDFGRI